MEQYKFNSAAQDGTATRVVEMRKTLEKLLNEQGPRLSDFSDHVSQIHFTYIALDQKLRLWHDEDFIYEESPEGGRLEMHIHLDFERFRTLPNAEAMDMMAQLFLSSLDRLRDLPDLPLFQVKPFQGQTRQVFEKAGLLLATAQ